MKLNLFSIRDKVTTLGPGTRFCIWTQGCPRRCPGCMTPQGQSLQGGFPIDTQALADRIVNSGLEGITISGGEPFLQAEALYDLICRVRARRDLGVILYTGYTLEAIRASNDPHYSDLLTVCDLLIDGEYVEALNDGRSLRGSANQRVIPLSSRYVSALPLYGAPGNRVEILFSEDKATVIGVPSKSMLRKLQELF